MKTEPLVCVITPTCNRPGMVAWAIDCFRRQTYRNKRLLVLNSGMPRSGWGNCDWVSRENGGVTVLHRPELEGNKIGLIRNFANEATSPLGAEIIVHFDDDDFSDPNRIAEQVEFLQSSGADVVGYNSWLVWQCAAGSDGPAWLYDFPMPTYAFGASFCYWRRVWKAKEFPESNYEDTMWQRGVAARGQSAFLADPYKPRLICRFHGGNAGGGYAYRYAIKHGETRELKPAPHWNDYCRQAFLPITVGLASC